MPARDLSSIVFAAVTVMAAQIVTTALLMQRIDSKRVDYTMEFNAMERRLERIETVANSLNKPANTPLEVSAAPATDWPDRERLKDIDRNVIGLYKSIGAIQGDISALHQSVGSVALACRR